MWKFYFEHLFKDKDGGFSLREFAIALFMLVVIVAWIGHQFFKKEIPEYMFISLVGLVAAGLFGYSIERKTKV